MSSTRTIERQRAREDARAAADDRRDTALYHEQAAHGDRLPRLERRMRPVTAPPRDTLRSNRSDATPSKTARGRRVRARRRAGRLAQAERLRASS